MNRYFRKELRKTFFFFEFLMIFKKTGLWYVKIFLARGRGIFPIRIIVNETIATRNNVEINIRKSDEE